MFVTLIGENDETNEVTPYVWIDNVSLRGSRIISDISQEPTHVPTETPTNIPTTDFPTTNLPTTVFFIEPSTAPSRAPTSEPTFEPTRDPTVEPLLRGEENVVFDGTSRSGHGFAISFGRDAWWWVVSMTIVGVVCVVVGFIALYVWQERKMKRQFMRNMQNRHMRAQTASHNTEHSMDTGV